MSKYFQLLFLLIQKLRSKIYKMKWEFFHWLELICRVNAFSTSSGLLTAKCKLSSGNNIFLSSLQCLLVLPCQWWLLHWAALSRFWWNEQWRNCVRPQMGTKGSTRDGLPSFKLKHQHCSGSSISLERSQLFVLTGFLPFTDKLQRYCKKDITARKVSGEASDDNRNNSIFWTSDRCGRKRQNMASVVWNVFTINNVLNTWKVKMGGGCVEGWNMLS